MQRNKIILFYLGVTKGEQLSNLQFLIYYAYVFCHSVDKYGLIQ